jgi:2-iminoacetate synthase ThiH
VVPACPLPEAIDAVAAEGNLHCSFEEMDRLADPGTGLITQTGAFVHALSRRRIHETGPGSRASPEQPVKAIAEGIYASPG